jgi:hypothetical protein
LLVPKRHRHRAFWGSTTLSCSDFLFLISIFVTIRKFSIYCFDFVFYWCDGDGASRSCSLRPAKCTVHFVGVPIQYSAQRRRMRRLRQTDRSFIPEGAGDQSSQGPGDAQRQIEEHGIGGQRCACPVGLDAATRWRSAARHLRRMRAMRASRA